MNQEDVNRLVTAIENLSHHLERIADNVEEIKSSLENSVNVGAISTISKKPIRVTPVYTVQYMGSDTNDEKVNAHW